MAKKLTLPKKGAADETPAKATKAAKAEKAEKSAEPESKYGVGDLAEMLGIAPASVRVHLRNNGIEKSGRSYGWNTKGDLEAVAKQIRPQPKTKAEKE